MAELSTNRRHHRVFLTKHTEYHRRDDECVAVRDRGSGLWLLDHAALRLRALTLPDMGQGEDFVGSRIQFWGRRTDVLTSPVTDIKRPGRPEVGHYISHARGGEVGSNRNASQLLVSCPA